MYNKRIKGELKFENVNHQKIVQCALFPMRICPKIMKIDEISKPISKAGWNKLCRMDMMSYW